MARLTLRDAKRYAHLLGILISGENPDGTDYAVPVEITNVEADVTLKVDELDSLKVRNADGSALAVEGTVSVTEPVSVDDGGGSLTVDGTVTAIPSRVISSTDLAIGNDGAAVPEGTAQVMMYVPALNAGILTVSWSIDGVTWVPFTVAEIPDSFPLPTTAGFVGSTRLGFILPYAGAGMKVRATSGAAQTATIRTVFVR
jgi:hypothetical protein